MTPLERRIERVGMVIAEAQSHLDTIKTEPFTAISQGAFLCDAAARLQKQAHYLQEILVSKYVKKGRAK
jgi:hypothetical protein